MEKEINHPYWDIYSKLTSLRHSRMSAHVKAEINRLVIEARLGIKDRLIINSLMMLPWFNVKMIEEIFFLTLRERFAYSVLSPTVLNILAKYSPLIDLGAGNGYNAWLLQQRGVEIIAIDAYPVEEGKNWFFHTSGLGFPTKAGRSWIKVERGGVTAIKDYPSHTLFLCWPPRNSMAMLSLSEYSGERLIFIGDKKCCANSDFYKKLKKDWKLEYAIETGSWSACHTEWLEIYSRRCL